MNTHHKYVLAGLACVCLVCWLSISTGMGKDVSSTEFIRGVDPSYVTRMEDKGGYYSHRDGTTGDVFDILSDNGVN
jgi:arabinogalactan endo-1,4-beta-galactosidase